MKTIQKIFLFLFGPSAFKMGLVVMAIFLYLSGRFYHSRDKGEYQGATKVLNILHEKSTDLRMVARGEKKVSDKVALVVVDELSLEKLGRWPWSRDKIALMIDTLVKDGAKVIGFDAVFAEADKNQSLSILDKIQKAGPLSPEVEDLIKAEISTADKDAVLADAIKRNAAHLVMGAYWDGRLDDNEPYQELCTDLVEQSTAEYSNLDNDAQPVILIDKFSYELSDGIRDALKQITDGVGEQSAEEAKAKGATEVEVKNASHLAKLKYCDTWLSENDPFKATLQEAWPQIQESDKKLANQSFDDFVNFIQTLGIKNNLVYRTGRWWMNIPALAKESQFTGYFNAFLDDDGTIRHSNLVVRYAGKLIPSMALKSVMVATNRGLQATLDSNDFDETKKNITELGLTNTETGEVEEVIPVDSRGRLTVNYAGPRYSFPHLSVGELLNGRETVKFTQRVDGVDREIEVKRSEFIKDKIFLFGATATGIFDLRVTPFDENFPGLETHANIVENLLNKSYVVPMKNEPLYMDMSLATLGIFLSLVLSYLGAALGLLITFATLAVLYFGDKFFLFGQGTVVAIVLPLALTASVYVAVTFYKYLTEERKKKAIRGTFAKYVSPAVVDEILKNPSNVELGGKKQRMTVLFSDVRGFTTISEKLDPQVLSSVLNAYLTPMTKLVFDNKGTLDKYMGDAIMAFFGAPISYADHAKMACRCALQMMEKLKVIEKEFTEKKLPMIDIGIGVNTGEMSVGNMGSDIVRSYTVMGDSVNLGSRLEGINKEYGTHIVISEFTYGDVKNDFVCRELDWVRVKGKNLPVKIFELISEKPLSEKMQESIAHFNAGFLAYHEQLWDKAIESFTKTLNLNPNDEPAKLYIERCTDYLKEPPGADWDGVFEMKTK